jgi:hypothetical protein
MEVDAVPRTGIAYYRDEADSRDADNAASLDELMKPESTPTQSVGADNEGSGEAYIDPKYSGGTKKGVWSTLTGWFSGSK